MRKVGWTISQRSSPEEVTWATILSYPCSVFNPRKSSFSHSFFSFFLGTQLVGIKRDRDALNVLYAHRRSHTRTHASRGLSGRGKREEKRRRQRAVEKKPTWGRGGEISRGGGGQREGEKRERREKKRNVYAGLPGSYQWSSLSTGDTRG